jgi:hypothetical protein
MLERLSRIADSVESQRQEWRGRSTAEREDSVVEGNGLFAPSEDEHLMVRITSGSGAEIAEVT